MKIAAGNPSKAADATGYNTPHMRSSQVQLPHMVRRTSLVLLLAIRVYQHQFKEAAINSQLASQALASQRQVLPGQALRDPIAS
jgi:hypothetical protein